MLGSVIVGALGLHMLVCYCRVTQRHWGATRWFVIVGSLRSTGAVYPQPSKLLWGWACFVSVRSLSFPGARPAS